MRTFACQNCGQLVFFENTTCLNCRADLGFDWPARELRTLEAATAAERRCANAATAACNWLVGRPGDLCTACLLTRTRPVDEDAEGLAAFRVAESAKRRLLFELGELGLPLEGHREHPGGLAFDLLSSGAQAVTTGHADSVVTLDLAESDDAHRERMRQSLDEPYRTVLGHFRHEVGHYYWLVLAADERTRERCRKRFGDERETTGRRWSATTRRGRRRTGASAT